MYCTANPTETGVALPALFRGTAQPSRYDTPGPPGPERNPSIALPGLGIWRQNKPQPHGVEGLFRFGTPLGPKESEAPSDRLKFLVPARENDVK